MEMGRQMIVGIDPDFSLSNRVNLGQRPLHPSMERMYRKSDNVKIYIRKLYRLISCMPGAIMEVVNDHGLRQGS